MTLSLRDIERLLTSGAARPVEIDGDPSAMPFSHLDHALQTASVLRTQFPDDPELAVAGLVHDIGHLLDGVGDAEHAEAGAAAVRGALGERVAGLVGLHVAAKRYLVARQAAVRGDARRGQRGLLGAPGWTHVTGRTGRVRADAPRPGRAPTPSGGRKRQS